MGNSTPPRHLLLFGDYSIEKLASVKALVQHAKTLPAAERFLREATEVIQAEFSRTDKAVHGWEGTTASLLEMAEAVDSPGGGNLAVATVLLCAGRLGQLIVHADTDPTILGSAHQPVDIIGFCGGLLPAAAAVAAQDTSQLFALAREMVSISFRLACEIAQRKWLIEDGQASWGRTYVGLGREHVQGILDKFHESQGISGPRRIAIGVVAKGWLTLIGPPSTVASLSSWSPEIRDAPSVPTDVDGPMHSCWSPKVDTAKILGSSPLLQQPLNPAKARILSPTGSCVAYDHPTLGSLVEEIVVDVAHKALYITDTISESVAGLTPRGDGLVKLWVMGPTSHQAAVTQTLKASGIDYEVQSSSKQASIPEDTTQHGRPSSGLVAIVGMAGRFPDNDTIDGFWADLLDGKTHIKEIPPSRFDINAFYDPTGTKPNSTTARHGAFLTSPGLFDHRLFNLSPREASQTDPGHRLLLTTTYEALQSAGYNPQGGIAAGGARVASYIGQAADEWREILNQRGADIYYVPGFSRAFAPSRLHHRFRFGGASHALDAACATSAAAVAMAAAALSSRECDMALAGGASVLVSPTTYAGLSRAGMLSTTGGCRTFHDDADGYARGEAVGVVVMKRLEDAIADNDRVLAVVRGAGRAYGVDAPSMTRPCAAMQEIAYARALRQSGVEPGELAFVEMHGTGTQAGDVEEVRSVIGGLAGGKGGRKRKGGDLLTVGAVKAAVGHGEGAAGITSVIKAIMMLRERQIPPQPGWPFELNHKFPDLAKSGIKIATEPTALVPSAEGDGKIKIVVNSFDASGGNVSIAMEEPPQQPPKPADIRPWHVVAVSARTPASLRQNCERLLAFLESHPETNLADLAYTTTARRMHEQLRWAYVGDSIAAILRQLRADLDKQNNTTPAKPRVPSRVFLFTGQGSQYAGMGASLFRTSRRFRETVLLYQQMATSMGLPEFVGLLSDGSGGQEEDNNKHKPLDPAEASTVQIQLAIVALELAMAKLVTSWGITPDAVMGHSLGEYAALCVAGVLSPSEALLLVGERAKLMEKHLVADAYAMLAVNMPEEDLAQQIQRLSLHSCAVACANAPSLTVASGPVGEIGTLKKALEADGQRATQLRVPYGFHSSQVEPVLDEYQLIARGTHFAEPAIPVVSTLTGRVHRTATNIFSPAYLARQARQKVDFCGAVEAGVEDGLFSPDSQAKTLWFEMGPDPVCLGLVRRCLDGSSLSSSLFLPSLKQSKDCWATLSELLKGAYEAGVEIDWPEFHKPFIGSLTFIELPTYAFDERDFWTPYMTTVDAMTAVSSETGTNEKGAPGFPTTTLQRVESDKTEGVARVLTFTSQLADEQLLAAIKGHVVGGFEICPLGVFQDIALTAAKHIFCTIHGNATVLPALSLRSVELGQGLIVDPDTVPHTVIQVTASYRVADAAVEVEFASKLTNSSNNKLTHHGKAYVAFDITSPWQTALPQTLYLVKSRIDTLQKQAEFGSGARRLAQQETYQLFSGVVFYAEPYQGLQEVILSGDCADAVGRVQLAGNVAGTSFHVSPYWIDAVTHLAGFVLNCGLRYPADVACLAVGFEAWHQVRELRAGGVYTVYTCLQDEVDGGGHGVRGDCYVFADSGELVQATLGIKFLRLKKAALKMILGGGRPSTAHSPKAPKAAHGPVSSPLPAANRKQNTATDHTTQINTMLAIIASESGCTPDELADDTAYTDLGVDSVMAINVLAQLGKELDLHLPAAFFLENETVGDSKAALLAHLAEHDIPSPPELVDDVDADTESESTSGSDSNSGSASTPTNPSHLLTPTAPTSPVPSSDSLFSSPKHHHHHHPDDDNSHDNKTDPAAAGGGEAAAEEAHLFHYQGPRTSDTPKLFFLPGIYADGGGVSILGSTFGYLSLPPLGSADLGVFGVEILGGASTITGGGDGGGTAAPGEGGSSAITTATRNTLVAAIRTEQPDGPYLLGGTERGVSYAVAGGLLERDNEKNSGESAGVGVLLLGGHGSCVESGNATTTAVDDAALGGGEQAQVEVVWSKKVRDGVALEVVGLRKEGRDEREWIERIPALGVVEVEVGMGTFDEFVGAEGGTV